MRSLPEDHCSAGPARSLAVSIGAGWWVVAALSLAACGGDTSQPPLGGGPAPYDPCVESANLDRAMIADFESQPMNSTTSNDGTASRIEPTSVVPSPLEAARCPGDDTAGSAFHVVATGFQSWGYSFGFNNLGTLPGAGATEYFDASSWTGISMWVRKGSAESASSIFASVADRFTLPSGGALFPEDERDLLLAPEHCPPDAGECYCNFDAVNVDTSTPDPDPLLSQCDRFGTGIGIATEWRFFKVPFERMRQRAYGRPSALSQPDVAIIGVEFGLDGEDWDFWIDDIAFYRDAPAVAD